MSEQKPIPENVKTEAELSKIPKIPKEKGGFEDLGLPEPTRYNDWEVKGRCSDF